MINFSEDAYSFTLRKALLYRSQGRFPRIILLARSCQGARFALCFDKAQDTDARMRFQDLEVLIDPQILEQYQGFELGTEQFFFAPRLVIKPVLDFRGCDCNSKCNNKTEDSDEHV
ncbi:MAG TPA: hypothetical protein P5533_00050 [Candidatus Cloacimonadota bacterium]|nr:hypothetical protein [Candidatus Cloacimonadota bacterium]